MENQEQVECCPTDSPKKKQIFNVDFAYIAMTIAVMHVYTTALLIM